MSESTTNICPAHSTDTVVNAHIRPPYEPLFPHCNKCSNPPTGLFLTAAIAANPEDAQAHYRLGNFYQLGLNVC